MMDNVIEIPILPARMFDDRTREALGRLADSDSEEAFAPWGLVMILSVKERVGRGYRQVMVNTSTQITCFGWALDPDMNAIFRAKSMTTRWREIAGGAYLCLLDDFRFHSFLNEIPTRFPAFAPPDADITQWEFEAMIFPGAVAIAWDKPLPRWDDGLEEVRRALADNLLIFVDQDESAHGYLSAMADVKRAIEATLSRPDANTDEAACDPLADLRVVSTAY